MVLEFVGMTRKLIKCVIRLLSFITILQNKEFITMVGEVSLEIIKVGYTFVAFWCMILISPS